MNGSSKRILTEERREIASTTDHSVLDAGTPPELAISLRNVGARIRHSVSQGYRTPPSNNFVKAQSTGTIFRSMNDTLRHVHTDLPKTCAQHFGLSKKRSLSVEFDEHDDEQEPEWQCPHKSSSLQTGAETSRPIKPLKFSKSSFVRTPSLPTGSSVADHHMSKTKEVVEEEDWSLNMPSETAEQQFEAMEF